MTAAAKTTLAQALVEAQANMPAVDKDAVNPHFKSKFTSLDHMIAKTRPVLNAQGLAIIQFPAVSDLGQPVLRTVIVHESGEQLQADAPLFLLKQDMQALGSAISYARRYAWASACGIASETDDDGEAASQPDARAKASPGGPKAADPVSQAAPSEPAPPGGNGGRGVSEAAAAPAVALPSLDDAVAVAIALAQEWEALFPEAKTADFEAWVAANRETASFRTDLAAAARTFKESIAKHTPAASYADKVPAGAKT